MSTDENVLKILEDLQAGQRALQDDVTAVKSETGKIPGLEQRLELQGNTLTQQGKLLNGVAATMGTVLEEQQAQRVDIRSLHTDMQSLHSEVHASKEELKGEIEEVKGEVRAAREEAKRDNMDLKATVVKKIQSLDRRTTNIEDQSGIENPEKH